MTSSRVLGSMFVSTGGAGRCPERAGWCRRSRGLVARRVATGDDRRTLRVDERREGSESEAMVIRGGNRLGGEVDISGSKNAVLALLAATLLAPAGEVTLSNVPLELTDVMNMVKVLESLGARSRVDAADSGALVLDSSSLTSVTPNSDYVRALRASFLVTGPLLARMGEARVALPGGCKIGRRPVDLHLAGLAKLGAEIEFASDEVRVSVPRNKRLVGAHVHFDYPSVGATETVLMAACCAEGETRITNAAREPEVEELGNFLVKIVPGVVLTGLGTGAITVKGAGASSLRASRSLPLAEVRHSVIPDRIEAGTFLACGAITGTECLTLRGVHLPHLNTIAAVLRDMGCEVAPSPSGGTESARNLVIRADTGAGLRAVERVETAPYPGFPTDMQPLMCALLSVARGKSTVRETVFENRMATCTELVKMGARIEIAEGNGTALIDGVPGGLVGARVSASDLRAGVALVVAGLAARGETVVGDMSHIDRGYVCLERKLGGIGADVRRINS